VQLLLIVLAYSRKGRPSGCRTQWPLLARILPHKRLVTRKTIVRRNRQLPAQRRSVVCAGRTASSSRTVRVSLFLLTFMQAQRASGRRRRNKHRRQAIYAWLSSREPQGHDQSTNQCVLRRHDSYVANRTLFSSAGHQGVRPLGQHWQVDKTAA